MLWKRRNNNAVSNSTEEGRNAKNSRLLKVGALFIAAISATGGAFANAYAPTVVEKVCPFIPFLGCPKDQVSELVTSIEGLSQNISKNSEAVTSIVAQLAQQNSDPATQRLIQNLTTEVDSIVLESQQISRRAANLGSITQGIVSSSVSVKGATHWFSLGTANFLTDDNKTTFAVVELRGNDGKSALVNLNGHRQWMSLGDRLSFESTTEGECQITYFGDEGNAAGFGISCSKK